MQELIGGKDYTLIFRNREEGVSQVVRKKMMLAGKYKYHAVFMHRAGYTLSFTYFELARMLGGRTKAA